MKVIVTEAAINDLIQIGQYIKRDSPERAKAFVDELYERCQRLGNMPRAFPLVPGHEQSGIRRRPHGNYLIFYVAKRSTVEILHILNGAMDYERILFSDD